MEQDYADVLAFSNAVRAKLGRKPVSALRKGRHNPHLNNLDVAMTCVVARTINYGSRNPCEVGNYTIWAHDDTELAHVPEAISDFIEAFDAGQIPALIGNGWAA